MKVYIAQLLCPRRHCVVASVGEFQSIQDAQTLGESLRTTFDSAVTAGIFDPWCGICKSRELRVEVAPTVYDTMAAAKPAIEMLERENAETAKYIKSTRN